MAGTAGSLGAAGPQAHLDDGHRIPHAAGSHAQLDPTHSWMRGAASRWAQLDPTHSWTPGTARCCCSQTKAPRPSGMLVQPPPPQNPPRELSREQPRWAGTQRSQCHSRGGVGNPQMLGPTLHPIHRLHAPCSRSGATGTEHALLRLHSTPRFLVSASPRRN